ncbi:MAG: hypothetical protein ACREBR_02980 [bacterium]
MEWWHHALHYGFERRSQTHDSGTLAIAWGDGSGTGTKGTFELISSSTGSATNLEMWMGTWNTHVHSQSSNWRELRTLLGALERERHHVPSRVAGRRFFYFTDNQVTYDLIRRTSSRSPGLQTLLLDIKGLELELDCALEVIHVPGRAMIRQGTDG